MPSFRRRLHHGRLYQKTSRRVSPRVPPQPTADLLRFFGGDKPSSCYPDPCAIESVHMGGGRGLKKHDGQRWDETVRHEMGQRMGTRVSRTSYERSSCWAKLPELCSFALVVTTLARGRCSTLSLSLSGSCPTRTANGRNEDLSSLKHVDILNGRSSFFTEPTPQPLGLPASFSMVGRQHGLRDWLQSSRGSRSSPMWGNTEAN